MVCGSRAFREAGDAGPSRILHARLESGRELCDGRREEGLRPRADLPRG